MISFTDAQLQAWMAAFLLPFFRILALFTAAPVLSIRSVPTRLRVGIALLLAVTLAPGNVPTAGIDLVSFKGLGYVAQEVMVGLAIGFAARLAFAAFDRDNLDIEAVGFLDHALACQIVLLGLERERIDLTAQPLERH